MALKSYQDLEVWQRSMELAEVVWRLSARFPGEERFESRASCAGRPHPSPRTLPRAQSGMEPGNSLQFLGIASGSLAETETFLLLSERLGLLPSNRVNDALKQAGTVGRLLHGLKRSLRERTRAGQ